MLDKLGRAGGALSLILLLITLSNKGFPDDLEEFAIAGILVLASLNAFRGFTGDDPDSLFNLWIESKKIDLRKKIAMNGDTDS